MISLVASEYKNKSEAESIITEELLDNLKTKILENYKAGD
jgi:hypothetical protein